MGQREGSPVWLLGCWWKEVMVSPDPDPDCVEWNPDWVEWDPDWVELDPDWVSAGLAGQEALGRGVESLVEAVMEAGRLWRPHQQGGGVWRLRGVSRRHGRQEGKLGQIEEKN